MAEAESSEPRPQVISSCLTVARDYFVSLAAGATLIAMQNADKIIVLLDNVKSLMADG